MFDEAGLELEIPPDMLRNNPNLVDDIAKQVAGEMAKKASGLYDYNGFYLVVPKLKEGSNQ